MECSYNASADKAGIGGSLENQRAPMKTLPKTQSAGLRMYSYTHARALEYTHAPMYAHTHRHK